MISKKLEKILKLGFFISIAIGSFLIFPEIGGAYCSAGCDSSPTFCSVLTESAVPECNGGVTPGCPCGCTTRYASGADDACVICKSGTCYAKGTGIWAKSHTCPDTADYNGRPCAMFSSGNPATEWNCIERGGGVWDTSERKCVQCDGGKVEKKICGNAGTKSTETCKDSDGNGVPDDADHDGIPDYCISLGCTVAGNGKCESACDPSVSPECDEQDSGMGVAVPGGICNNCVFVRPCSWQDDNCGDPCAATERHQTCGPVGCSGNCDGQPPGSTRCVDELTCHPCEETCTCTCPDVCPCSLGGDCPPELLGGLVPCGRGCNDPCTKECECCPCTLCHLFVLFKRIVDFLTLYILFPLAVLMIVVGGVMFLTAAGDPGRIGTAKKILTAVVIGLVIIFLAWLIVDTIISFLTTGSPFEALFKQWNTINCPICGDGNCDSGETPENCPADCKPACSWQNDACGAPCPATERHQTCGPAGCSGSCDGKSEGDTQCIADPACGAPLPACFWQNDACGAPCPATERHQTCGPAGCSGNCSGQPAGSTRCTADLACVSPCGCLCNWCPAVLNPPCP